MFRKGTEIDIFNDETEWFFWIKTKCVKLQPKKINENVIHTPLGNMHIEFNNF